MRRCLLLFLCSSCASFPSVSNDLLERSKEHPNLDPDEIAVRWLGAAGFEVRTENETLLIDPFLSRPSTSNLFLGRLAHDTETLERALPDANLILVGHSHYDHVFDAPVVAKRTGAILVGSKTSCIIAESLGAEQCRIISQKGEPMLLGSFSVRAIPSEHSRIANIGVPLPGKRTKPLGTRHPHASQLPAGQVYAFVVRVNGFTLVHVGSAGLPADPTQLEDAVPEGADLLLPAIIHHRNTPGYTRSLIAQLHPRLIIPHHATSPTGLLTDHPDEDAKMEFDSFVKEARGAMVQVPQPFVWYRFRRPELKAKAPGKLPNTIGLH